MSRSSLIRRLRQRTVSNEMNQKIMTIQETMSEVCIIHNLHHLRKRHSDNNNNLRGSMFHYHVIIIALSKCILSVL